MCRCLKAHWPQYPSESKGYTTAGEQLISPSPLRISALTRSTACDQDFILDHNNVSHPIRFQEEAHDQRDTLTLEYVIDTKSYPGSNTIFSSSTRITISRSSLRSIISVQGFLCQVREQESLAGLTFDNVHILNDDIVSAKTTYPDQAQEPGAVPLLTDTALMKVQLKYPDGSTHPIISIRIRCASSRRPVRRIIRPR